MEIIPIKHTSMIELITYPDTLGKNLTELRSILNKYFSHVIGGIHILPYYPSSADRGFAPLTHTEVDPSFGTWEDIHALAKDYAITSDLIVNHISSQSSYFQDFLRNGKQSVYADYFITPAKFSRRIFPRSPRTNKTLLFIDTIANTLRHYDKLLHIKGINKYALQKIYRPRPGSPFVEFTDYHGATHSLWCTFSNAQIDLDINNAAVQELLRSYIHNLSKHGITSLRLDAVGYVIKKRGTPSFMIPETYAFITEIAQIAHAHNMTVLPEVHGHYTQQLRLAQTPGVDYTYDFQLPILAIHALFSNTTKKLVRWIDLRPNNIVTTLDTHDGLPIVDVADLLSKEEIDAVVAQIKKNGGNATLRASGKNAQNVDIYQINCTYYSALGEHDDAYIVARAIQCFIPGTPQIYYVGLLAGITDEELLKKTDVGRNINRHAYSVKEIQQELQRPVVKRLMKILAIRNNHPVFDNGTFSCTHTEHTLTLTWKTNHHTLRATVNVKTMTVEITYTDPTTHKQKTFLA